MTDEKTNSNASADKMCADEEKRQIGKNCQKRNERGTMMTNPVNVVVKENDKIELTFVCPVCGNEHSMVVNKLQLEQIARYYEGFGYVQDIDLNPADREKLVSGFCDECQKAMFD